VLKKSVLDFFKASWQKRCFAKMLKLLKWKDRFNNLARRPGARSLFFNRLLLYMYRFAGKRGFRLAPPPAAARRA
jgi:hypothetical protein